MKQVDTKSLINYIALKILGGNDYLLNALEEYLVKGEGPATVAYRYGISKHQLRGYTQRIIEKSGGEPRARKIIPILKRISKGVKPIVTKEKTSGLYKCTKCDINVQSDDAEEHVREAHKDLLTLAIRQMTDELEKVKMEINKKKEVVVTSTQ
ncbi:hypothetical protein HS7_08110 [Sulfolobales archaeon HS-7]|nr:hypothetical protein HS7_08110 [Sulfolobales archaeon HS-7]